MVTKNPDISTVINDPEFWLHRYEEDSDAFRYIHVPRDLHRNLTFITDEHLPKDLETHSFSRRDLSQFQPKTGSINFIFHSAYCCSTMLARAFDIPGISMGLKEPQVLNDMIGWRRRGAQPRDVAAVTDHALKMLARPFESDEAVIIKPSNIVNPMAAMLMAMNPESKALLLYAPIESFLVSIAKKDMWGRKWVRDLLIGIAKDGYLVGNLSTEELLQLTDLQIAALGWLSQHRLFQDIQNKVGMNRVCYLDSNSFLGNQRKAFESLAEFFQLSLSADQIDQIMTGPAFTTHSKLDENKSGMTFDVDARNVEQQKTEKAHGKEIMMVSEWIKAFAEKFEISIEHPSIVNRV